MSLIKLVKSELFTCEKTLGFLRTFPADLKDLQNSTALEQVHLAGANVEALVATWDEVRPWVLDDGWMDVDGGLDCWVVGLLDAF